MTIPFFPVPSTRAPGTVNPAGDMDNTALELAAMGGTYNVLNANYSGGADPTGAADSTAAINAALAAASAGTMVVLPVPGVYKTSAPLTPPPGVGLVSAGSGQFNTGAVIKPSASFAGSAVIAVSDVASAATQGPVLRGFSIDGTNLPGTTDGIRATGPINLAVLADLGIYNCTGIGINQVTDAGATPQNPYGWWVRDVKINNCAQGGITLPGHTDGQWRTVHVIGNGNTSGHGIAISGAPSNSRFTDIRAEWTGTGDGWHLTGAWNTGTGSGPFLMTGCSSDRNQQNGFFCSATGNAPVMLANCMFRRDGRNSKTGGGSFAGINLSSASVPLFFSNVAVWPGVDDDGTGTESPQYGVSFSSVTFGQILSGYIQGASAAVNGSITGSQLVAPNVILASGTTGGPATNLTDFYRPSNGVLQTDNAIQAPSSFVSAQRFNPGGITGATAASRIVGAIASGTAPASGSFNTGDLILVQTGSLLVCTAGGSPGTWTVVS